MNGWVKLHKQIIENDFLQNDMSAYVLFTKLLLVARIKDGTYTTGRYKLESLTGLKATTAYKALQRLETEGMVTQVSNNRFTTISICNWSKFQGKDNSSSNNEVTTKGQPSNNQVTLNKKKEVRSKNKDNVSKDTDVSKLYYQYLKKYKIAVVNHNTLRIKIKEFENLYGEQWCIDYLVFMINDFESVNEKYKPSITGYLDLFTKAKKIDELMKKTTTKQEIY
jgi:hypothetical protein